MRVFPPRPEAEASGAAAFKDFILPDDLVDIQVTPRGKLILFVRDEGGVAKVVFKRRAVASQLLRLAGIRSVREAWRRVRGNPGWLAAELGRRLLEGKTPVVVSARRVPGPAAAPVYVAFRAATEDYVPVPHKILFDWVAEAVGRRPDRIRRLLRRTAGWWLAAAEDGVRTWLVVTNANTARDAIHVYVVHEFETAGGSARVVNGKSAVRVAHRGGDPAPLLARVAAAARRALEAAAEEHRAVLKVARRLASRWLGAAEAKERLLRILRGALVPEKYRRWALAMLSRRMAGDETTELAVLMTAAELAGRLEGRNLRAAEKLYALVRREMWEIEAGEGGEP